MLINRKEMMNMETRRFDKKDVKEVAELLKNGQVVAFPTDTVVWGSFMRMRKPCAN